jgi:hypothetical protein
MADWIVKTYHKKNVEQHEYFVQREGSGRIKVTDGFRWATFRVTTTDDNFPEFEFEKVPGGNDAQDSLNLFSVSGPNIEDSELIDMFDGGCWGDIEITGLDEEEEEEIQDFIEENGAWALEDEGEWYLEDTECWVWGPIEITNEDDESIKKIIIADEDGNVSDFHVDER